MSGKCFLSTVHLNGDQNLRSKILTSPKLKKLQRPILIHKLPLLPATSIPSFMQFRYTVTEKFHQNVMPCV